MERIHVEAAAVEVDRRDEVLHAAVAPRHVLYPLDLRVDRLAPGVRHLQSHVRQDVLDPALEHFGNLDYRLGRNVSTTLRHSWSEFNV